MKCLVTGFDPFGGEKVNPSYELAARLPDEIDGAELIKLVVPTQFGAAVQVVREKIETVNPDIWLGVGQAGGRSCITVERVAINVMDARIPDNAGHQPIDEPVEARGPAAYFSTLPVRRMVAALEASQIPAAISNSAGTFVCNNLMYGVLHLAAGRKGSPAGGFMHIPYLPEQVVDKNSQPSMTLEMSLRAVEIALRVAIEEVRQLGK